MYTGSLEATSNQETWEDAYGLYDASKGPDEYIDLTGCSVTLSVRDDHGCIRLTGSSEDGIVTFPEPGAFQWSFPENQMNGLSPGTYDVGVRISKDGKTVQLIIGSVSVLDGIDRQ